MNTAGQNDAGVTPAAPARPAQAVSEGQRQAFVERLLWTFAVGAAVYAAMFALWFGGWGGVTVGRPSAPVVSLSLLLFPVLVALAVMLVAHRIRAYRGVALIGFFIAVVSVMAGFGSASVHPYIGAGLLIWAFKAREQVLVWAGVTSLVLAAANVFLGAFMVPRPYAGSVGGDEFGPMFTMSPHWVGLFGAAVLVALALYQRRRRARSRG